MGGVVILAKGESQALYFAPPGFPVPALKQASPQHDAAAMFKGGGGVLRYKSDHLHTAFTCTPFLCQLTREPSSTCLQRSLDGYIAQIWNLISILKILGCNVTKYEKNSQYYSALILSLQDERSTYHHQSHDSPLQQSCQYVTPVMFVIRHPRQARVHRGGDQEELKGWSEQPRPLDLKPCLQVEL
ncbi:hypothetical protein AMECASPLE_007212 [Ameca splendens]|uniref:Uncharacterized protein n=1 Tax=Ameca splendens TaxID=208324 RepID=A0ABV0YMF1_9TELE